MANLKTMFPQYQVRNGAKLLDEVRPGWYCEVDTETLDMSDPDQSVGAHIYGSYDLFMRAFGYKRSGQFMSQYSETDNAKDISDCGLQPGPMLTVHWKEEVANRLDSLMETGPDSVPDDLRHKIRRRDQKVVRMRLKKGSNMKELSPYQAALSEGLEELARFYVEEDSRWPQFDIYTVVFCKPNYIHKFGHIDDSGAIRLDAKGHPLSSLDNGR